MEYKRELKLFFDNYPEVDSVTIVQHGFPSYNTSWFECKVNHVSINDIHGELYHTMYSHLYAINECMKQLDETGERPTISLVQNKLAEARNIQKAMLEYEKARHPLYKCLDAFYIIVDSILHGYDSLYKVSNKHDIKVAFNIDRNLNIAVEK